MFIAPESRSFIALSSSSGLGPQGTLEICTYWRLNLRLCCSCCRFVPLCLILCILWDVQEKNCHTLVFTVGLFLMHFMLLLCWSYFYTVDLCVISHSEELSGREMGIYFKTNNGPILSAEYSDNHRIHHYIMQSSLWQTLCHFLQLLMV